MPTTPSAAPDAELPHGLGEALATASLERSLMPPPELRESLAIVLRAYWIHPDPALSRVCALVADASRARGGARAPPGILAQALADRARDLALQAGARPPRSWMDDFPSSPAMASADVCSVSCAVEWPDGLGVEALDAAIAAAADSIFEPGRSFRRHIKLSLAGGGALESKINGLILDLRAARAAKP